MTKRQAVIIAVLSILALTMGLDLYLLKGEFIRDFGRGFRVDVSERRIVPRLR